MLSSVAYPALQYFSTLPLKGTIFDFKKFTEHKTCFDFLYNILSEIPLRRIARDMMKNVFWSSCPILIKLEFSRYIFGK